MLPQSINAALHVAKVAKPSPIGIGIRIDLNIKPSPFIYGLITKNAMGVNITITTALQLHILRFKVCYKIHADSFGKLVLAADPLPPTPATTTAER
jgi:hypothetical protein